MERHLEDPIPPLRASQPLPHVHQHGVDELAPPLAVVATDTCGEAPPGVEGEPLHRLPIRKPFETLEHHHRGHHRGRHRAPAQAGEQVGEELVREEPVALAVQEGVDALLPQRRVAEPGDVVEKIALPWRRTERQRASPANVCSGDAHSR